MDKCLRKTKDPNQHKKIKHAKYFRYIYKNNQYYTQKTLTKKSMFSYSFFGQYYQIFHIAMISLIKFSKKKENPRAFLFKSNYHK